MSRRALWVRVSALVAHLQKLPETYFWTSSLLGLLSFLEEIWVIPEDIRHPAF